MGTGIGIVGSKVAGLNVSFVDPSTASLQKSESFINNWCKKEMAKERMTQEGVDQMLSRISFHSENAILQESDFVVEAVSEDFELKKRIF